MDAKGRVLSDKCIVDEVPFEELPAGWAWARLGTICRKLTDGSHNPPTKQSSGYPVISATNIANRTIDLSVIIRYCDENGFRKENPRTQIKRGDIILGIIGGSIGNVGVYQSSREVIAQRSVAIIDSVGCNGYLSWALESPLFYEYYKSATGTAQGGIYLQALSSVFLPLPPLAEQRRIVERVAELAPLVEEYGKLEDAREELDAALPDRLRKSVLQMAVQGKLVPQDPADEPAGALLGRIREQRAELVRQKKMKAPKGGESVIFTGSDGRRYEKRVDSKGRESGPVCIEDEIPFDIPGSWEWARLESIAHVSGGATPDKSNPAYWDGEIPWASMKDVHGDYLESTLDSITQTGLESKPSISICEPGDLIISTRLIPGKSIISCISAAINQDLKVLRLDEFDTAYLHLWFQSQLDFFKRLGSGTTVPGIKVDQLSLSLIPIPPLSEQHRIVERVNELIPRITNQ